MSQDRSICFPMAAWCLGRLTCRLCDGGISRILLCLGPRLHAFSLFPTEPEPFTQESSRLIPHLQPYRDFVHLPSHVMLQTQKPATFELYVFLRL